MRVLKRTRRLITLLLAVAILHHVSTLSTSATVLGQGQYRNAVASGESRNRNNSSLADVQRRPDATALRY